MIPVRHAAMPFIRSHTFPLLAAFAEVLHLQSGA
jgi:hypothetical protein